MQKIEESKKNEKWNEYFYPGTYTFINKLNIKDDLELQKKEAELSFNKLVELNESAVVGNFDLNHLCYINYYIFQDLYDWAGKIRNVNISTGKSNFSDVSVLKDSINYELNLMQEDFRNVYSKEGLASFLAEYYTYLLEVHPFRDGNGRTVREFLREFVLVKTKESFFGEYELDWSKIDNKKLHDSMSNSKLIRYSIEEEFNKALVCVKSRMK